jgi:cytoskeletal protein CcmA (bactofilin family)
VGIFSKSKGGRDKKSLNETRGAVRLDEDAESGESSSEIVSMLGHGMLITGNIVCDGSVHIFGRVFGDIQASHLVIGEGAKVEGNIIAQELIIHGAFNGTIHGNSVKLQSTAMVDGDIYNKSLTIEQNAQFEGASRRIEKPVSPPSNAQVKGEMPLSPSMANAVPASGAVG